jgi:hypothetical protein
VGVRDFQFTTNWSLVLNRTPPAVSAGVVHPVHVAADTHPGFFPAQKVDAAFMLLTLFIDQLGSTGTLDPGWGGVQVATHLRVGTPPVPDAMGDKFHPA